jgi:hypothetical protein
VSGSTAERYKPGANLPITGNTMRAALCILILGVPLVLAGCGQRFDVAQTLDRNGVFVRCSAQAVASVNVRDRHLVRAAMRRLDACMAEQRLPGYAMYDARSHAVRYAYEADTPHLHF